MYVLAPNQIVETYPYSIGKLRRDNPNTSFPRQPNETLLAEWGVFPVIQAAVPSYDPRVERVAVDAEPTLSGGAWTLGNAIVALTAQEREERAERERIPKARAATEKAQAIVLKEQIAAKIEDLPDEEKAALTHLFDPWAVDVAYVIGDIVEYQDLPYKSVQAHTSQSDWTPDTVPALFTPLRVVSGANPDPWVQPTGAQDAYAIGDRVTHDNPNDSSNIWIYESAIAANTTEPGRDGAFDRYWTPVEAV